jgi:cytochrome c553
MKHLMQVAVTLLLLISIPAFAVGDVADGQAKSAICAACHGADGNSAVPMWPKIAGQNEAYLKRQLDLIKSGARPVPEMTGIVAGMTEQDFTNLAAYYATQTTSAGLADEGSIAVAEGLYKAGDPSIEAPACMACHGPAGEGNPLAGYPKLAGQHAVYTEKMLMGFRSGTTWGEEDSSSGIMVGVSHRLTDAQIKALASYIQGLHSNTE